MNILFWIFIDPITNLPIPPVIAYRIYNELKSMQSMEVSKLYKLIFRKEFYEMFPSKLIVYIILKLHKNIY